MGGITSDVDLNQIEGGTDGTAIGNIGDRLKVQANSSGAPSDNVIYKFVELDNAGSIEMDVDGSGTSVVFSAGPAAGEIWYVFEMGLTIEDSGANKFDTFGALSALTNGLLVDQVVSSTTYEFINLKTNKDVVETFSDHFVRGQATAFINSANFFTGKVELRNAITLVGDNSDEIKVTVRDNLTGINLLHFNIEYMRII